MDERRKTILNRSAIWFYQKNTEMIGRLEGKQTQVFQMFMDRHKQNGLGIHVKEVWNQYAEKEFAKSCLVKLHSLGLIKEVQSQWFILNINYDEFYDENPDYDPLLRRK